MRYCFFFLIIFALGSCKQQTDFSLGDFNLILDQKMDTLVKRIVGMYLNVSYGETMLLIQSHHYKLWFAGMAENWDLADFYHHETEEHFELLEEYRADKEATKHIKMIKPFLEKIDRAIEEQNLNKFEKSFHDMTQTCTQCHQISGHPKIVIQVPTENPYTNQTFKK